MRRFLRFTIEESMAGRAADLKETTIGLAVFDRAPDYDPRVDPIVRVEARRLREKLSQYYSTEGRNDRIAIELPRGGYAPTVRERAEQECFGGTEWAGQPVASLAPTALQVTTPPAPPESWKIKLGRRRYAIPAIVIVAALGLTATGIALLLGSKANAMRGRDAILLGEFANRTGESVFDFTLSEALATQLSQSPFLSVVPGDRVRQTLTTMGRSPDEPLTEAVALEVCRRLSVKAMLAGSISRAGNQYVVSLEATNCQTSEGIDRDQRQIERTEQVLPAVGKMASRMRRALGESLATIQRFDAPIEETTTKSLEALRSYALGQRERAMGNEVQSIAFFTHAIDLDPNFASAYNSLSNVYSNLGESERAREYVKMAFERRDHVSERERLNITYQYYDVVMGDQPRVIQTLEVWKQSFPREFQPVNSLAFLHNEQGRFDLAVEDGLEAIRRNPSHGFPYSNLAIAYRGLGRFDDARTTAQQAVALRVDTTPLRAVLYQLAVIAGNTRAATEYLEKAKGTPQEFDMVGMQAQALA